MQSEWKVMSNYINDEKMYAVYRIKNTKEVMHSGNIEIATDYMLDKNEAEEIAKKFNRFENQD